MGYKLAGWDHLGGVEIDPRMADLYSTNLAPKYLYTEDLRIFNLRTDLPDELYSLDLLDGSPPCSTFSMSGVREAGWGVEKVFREGQARQTLDDLVFIYCDTILKLQPKIAILENVEGIIRGAARSYCSNIMSKLKAGGYDTQAFLLDSSLMGVPQKRKRVFFIARRSGLHLPPLNLRVSGEDRAIPFGRVRRDDLARTTPGGTVMKTYWDSRRTEDSCLGDSAARMGVLSGYGNVLIKNDKVFPTLASSTGYFLMNTWGYPNDSELISVGSFPRDYDFRGQSVKYVVGMSVPPVMMAHVAHQIAKQWFGA